jgi:hypothetical protein
MNNKISLEEEVKTFKKHMGAILSLVKDLKARVETFEKKMESKENEEVKEIVETHLIKL